VALILGSRTDRIVPQPAQEGGGRVQGREDTERDKLTRLSARSRFSFCPLPSIPPPHTHNEPLSWLHARVVYHVHAPASASRSCSSVASVGRPVMKHVSVSVPSDDATKGTGPRYKTQHSERSKEEQQGQALLVHTPEGHEDTYAAHATRDTPCSHHPQAHHPPSHRQVQPRQASPGGGGGSHLFNHKTQHTWRWLGTGSGGTRCWLGAGGG
jgi:hypothetical protein